MAKILLVEDDKQIASYLGELLCDEGFAVTQAGSKAEAKNKLLENQFASTSSTATGRKTLRRSAPTHMTLSSTARSSEAVQSVSTRPTCRKGCSRCWASARRTPTTSSGSSSTPSSSGHRPTEVWHSDSTACARSLAGRRPSGTISRSLRIIRGGM